MKILITGGAGFIGTNLCKYFIDTNNEVICIDNFYSGLKNNIKDLLNNKKFTFIEHDIRNPYYFDVDIIINCACPASPVFYQKDPIYTEETCFLGMKNALECAKKY